MTRQTRLSVKIPKARWSAWIVRIVRGGNPYWLWSFAAAELVALVVWMLLDPRFDDVASRLQQTSGGLGDAGRAVTGHSAGQLRSGLLAALIGLVLLTLVLALLRLIWGSRRHRTMRAWLVFVTFFGLCLAIFVGWTSITWWGKQRRLQSQVSGFEPFASELRDDWPSDDGILSSQDPYMAYPIGTPTTLVMLTSPILERDGTSFRVVERGASGALRFELAGREAGDWLEWHPADEQPASFVGGLLDTHELQQFWELGDGWFVVRYRQ
ncbi:MAG: hypothetical protein AAF961_02925 [Planctomycetota bacterium]